MGNRATACGREEDVAMMLLRADDPRDTLATQVHLDSCSTCQAAARDADRVFAALAESAHPIPPPPDLRDRVLAITGEHRAVAPTPITTARSSKRRSGRAGRWAGTLTAVAAAAALMAGVGWQYAQVQGQRDAATAHAGSLTDAIIADVSRYPHAVLVDRAGRPLAAVAVEGDRRTAYNLALGAPPPGRTWTLWGFTGGTATPLGQLPATSATSPGAEQFEAYGVSEERLDGAPLRPGELVATGKVEPPSR